jgi:hypothetical protein
VIAVGRLINIRAQAPEQAQIAFYSSRDGNYEICVMDADGGNPRNLTNHPSIDESPTWWFDPAFARNITPVSSVGMLKRTWGWLKQNGK